MSQTDHYVVLGAGAVGGNMGALLALAGQRVTLVGRPALVEAVARQKGLIHVAAGESRLVPIEAVSDINQVSPAGPVTLLITTKAGDLAGALESARQAVPRDTLTVTWQNGIRAEDRAIGVFPNLLGGIVRATSTMLVPGEVRIRTPGVLIVGRYPAPVPGVPDPARERVVRDLVSAGFDAVASADIRADKGLKLLLNLISGASPLVRLDGTPAPNLTRVESAVLIEGARILAAAGISARSESGKGDDVRTMLNHLAARPTRARITDSVHNSTWQNLAITGRRLENDFMNGEIVELARGIGRQAPWNARLLSLLEDVNATQAGPECFTDAELGSRFADLEPPAAWTEEDEEKARTV